VERNPPDDAVQAMQKSTEEFSAYAEKYLSASVKSDAAGASKKLK
jgi:hypothetical protein